ncbi:unnamed protein product [Darwinula stevensoni]|uniref:Uncharacterized protein n=1 Tax=Darwinula stevensoni TaxID=69355 RepID=A0A7R8XFJ3_9CRUS|nr:unnamed protein product [Darwinula stevensoni]CAG0891645.1 unnamed protein product [Darwinula stevensoni]
MIVAASSTGSSVRNRFPFRTRFARRNAPKVRTVGGVHKAPKLHPRVHRNLPTERCPVVFAVVTPPCGRSSSRRTTATRCSLPRWIATNRLRFLTEIILRLAPRRRRRSWTLVMETQETRRKGEEENTKRKGEEKEARREGGEEETRRKNDMNVWPIVLVVILGVSYMAFSDRGGMSKYSRLFRRYFLIPGESLEIHVHRPPFQEVEDPGYGSAWCNPHHIFGMKRPLCQFRNLCYSADPKRRGFAFFVGRKSSLDSLPSPEETEEYFHISLDPNAHRPYPTERYPHDEETLKRFRFRFFNGSVLLLHRSAEDGFHLSTSFHNDLMPLYFTLQELCVGDVEKCSRSYTLFLVDDGDLDPADEYLYRPFADAGVILGGDLSEDADGNTFYCFRKAYAGLSDHSFFYDFGNSKRSESPIEALVTGFDVQHFNEYLVKRLCRLDPWNRYCDGKHRCGQMEEHSVVLLRESNGRILNEGEVRDTMERIFTDYFPKFDGVKVLDVSGDPRDYFLEVACTVRNAKLLVAYHGQALTFSTFLKQGSGLLELLPWEAESGPSRLFYRSLAELRGKDVFYRSWIAPGPDSHPGWEAKHSKSLPYRANFDVSVDMTSFQVVLHQLLSKMTHYRPMTPLMAANVQHPIVPGKVFTFSHQATDPKTLTVEWEEPWNVKYLEYETVGYEIILVPENDLNTSKRNFTYVTERKMTYTDADNMLNQVVFIHCVLDRFVPNGERRGPQWFYAIPARVGDD